MRVYIKFEPAAVFAHPEDMSKILSYLGGHGVLRISVFRVEQAYQAYSAMQGAGTDWLPATDVTIAAFADWLNDIKL